MNGFSTGIKWDPGVYLAGVRGNLGDSFRGEMEFQRILCRDGVGS